VTLCPAEFDRHIAAFDIAGLGKTLAEVSHGAGGIVSRSGTQEPYHRHRRLLRARRERPRRRAAEKANELTSPHIRTQAQGPTLYRLKRVL
jgi:hypothetical protein